MNDVNSQVENDIVSSKKENGTEFDGEKDLDANNDSIKKSMTKKKEHSKSNKSSKSKRMSKSKSKSRRASLKTANKKGSMLLQNYSLDSPYLSIMD